MNADRKSEIFEGQLLGEFGATAAEAWREKLAGDLGDGWEEGLRWDAGEGLQPRAFYRAEDLAESNTPTGAPGLEAGWRIRHTLAATDGSGAAREIGRALGAGADALGVPARLIASEEALGALKAGLEERGDLALHLEGTPEDARRLFADVSGEATRGSLAFDPAARRLQSEDVDASEGYHALAALVEEHAGSASGLRLVTADARPFHHAGAGPVESLALALAAMSEHFARLGSEGLAAETVARHAQMMLPVGTRFFVEVARLRAARRLFAQLAAAYGAGGNADGAGGNAPPRVHVQAETAWRPMTLYDPHLNLLRGATAGATAAAIGGADVLAVRPFTGAAARQEQEGKQTGDQTGNQTGFARRLSLHAQHILREEAHLGRVADPAAGSYHAEVLTDRLARRAWERFQEIEANGGLLAALQQDAVQERLAEARAERTGVLSRRQRVRVGTNHYPNLGEERLGDALPEDALPEGTSPGAGASVPGPFPRETAPFERLRLATERHARQQDAKRPATFLLPVGTPKVRSARARFARNALGCAGLRAIQEHVGFDSAEAGARAAAEAIRRGDAQLVACCAPDDDYAALLPALRNALGDADAWPGVPVVVAGRPGALPEDEREAVDAFVYRGMDLLATLEALQRRLDIEPIETPKSKIQNRHAS